MLVVTHFCGVQWVLTKNGQHPQTIFFGGDLFIIFQIIKALLKEGRELKEIKFQTFVIYPLIFSGLKC